MSITTSREQPPIPAPASVEVLIREARHRGRRQRLLVSLAVLGVGVLTAVVILFSVGGSGSLTPRGALAPLAGPATGTPSAREAARVCSSRFTQPYSRSNPYSRNYVYAAYPTTVARLAAVSYMTRPHDWPSYDAYPGALRLVVCVIDNPVTGKAWTTGCPPKLADFTGPQRGIRYQDALGICIRKATPSAKRDLWVVPVPAHFAGFAARHHANYLPAELGFGTFPYKVPPTGW